MDTDLALQMLTGEGDWAGGIVGLERNPDVVKDLTALCEYALEVLKTMPESAYRSDIEKRTNFKLKVYKYPSLFPKTKEGSIGMSNKR